MTDAARPSRADQRSGTDKFHRRRQQRPYRLPLRRRSRKQPLISPTLDRQCELARERGIDLRQVKGQWVMRPKIPRTSSTSAGLQQRNLARSRSGQVEGLGLLPWPKVDFARLEHIEFNAVTGASGRFLGRPCTAIG